jgi:chromosome segregation ATPase
MLNKLQIKCGFLENGCKEVVLLEKLRQHMDCCKYNPKGICRECGVKNGDRGLHNCVENLISHIKSIEKLKLNIIEKNLVLEKGIQKSIKENLEINKEVKNLRKENYLIEEENRRLKQSVSSLRHENNKVKSKWEIDNFSLEKLRKMNSDLVNRNREINNKLENIIEYKNTYEDIMRRRSQLKEEVDRLEANKESLKQQNAIITKNNFELKNEISGLNVEKVKISQHIESLNKTNVKLKNENFRLMKYCGENETLIKSNKSLKSEINSLSNELKLTKKHLDEERHKNQLFISKIEC